MSGRRYFTVEEANAALPKVIASLATVRAAVAGLERLRPGLTDEDGDIMRPLPDTQVQPAHLHAVSLFHHALAQIQSIGVEIKDVERGLIDFPARDGGDEIRLCWLDGEPEVAWFHDLTTGFSGRKPIAELKHRGEKS